MPGVNKVKSDDSFLQASALPLGYRDIAQPTGKEWVLRFVEKALASSFAGYIRRNHIVIAHPERKPHCDVSGIA
jgi:hypothetical protein